MFKALAEQMRLTRILEKPTHLLLRPSNKAPENDSELLTLKSYTAIAAVKHSAKYARVYGNFTIFEIPSSLDRKISLEEEPTWYMIVDSLTNPTFVETASDGTYHGDVLKGFLGVYYLIDFKYEPEWKIFGSLSARRIRAGSRIRNLRLTSPGILPGMSVKRILKETMRVEAIPSGKVLYVTDSSDVIGGGFRLEVVDTTNSRKYDIEFDNGSLDVAKQFFLL